MMIYKIYIYIYNEKQFGKFSDGIFFFGKKAIGIYACKKAMAAI